MCDVKPFPDLKNSNSEKQENGLPEPHDYLICEKCGNYLFFAHKNGMICARRKTELLK